jgi:hypothetical protein
MRTTVPGALAALAVALLAGLPVLFLQPAPAQAAAIYVETTPSTARPGDEVGIRASCTDNLTAATVSSSALGNISVKPNFGLLTATVTLSTSLQPGAYRINLVCPDKKTAATTLHVVARVTPSRGPATGGGGTAPNRSAPMLIGGGATALVAGLVLAAQSVRRRRFS